MPKCDLNTRYIPATLAWTLLLGTTALFFYYPCHWYLLRHPWVPAYQGVITFFVLANFTLATFMDPGVIPKAPPDEDREDDFRAPLYKSVEINGITVRMKWCVTCKFYRPPRCSHCSVCNHCIETFDHHCPWVNNCIGRRNYRFFFFFLISLSIHMLSIFGLSLFFVMNIGTNINAVEPIVSMAIMGVIALLAIPIFGLAGFHMVLVSRGRTTNEQVTGKFTGGFNPFSRGCWNNCCYTQFGPHFPSLKKPQRYLYKPSKKQQRRAIPPAANGGAGERVETAVSTIEHHHVKTYTADNNGGVQHAHYNKLLANNRNNDLESSVSADCEPTPPSRRPPAHYPRLSPATQGYRVVLDGTVNGTLTSGGPTMVPMAMMPQQLHMGGARPSPTAAARVRALGIPTPLTLGSPVRRSNPGTPTASRRPDALAARRTFLSEGELLSSQPIPKATVSPAAWNDPARPVSFTRALDIHNALSPPQTHSGGPTPERASLYDCNNYEISV